MAVEGRKWSRPSNIIIAVLAALLLAFAALVPRHLTCVQPENQRPEPRLEQLPMKKQIVLHTAQAPIAPVPRG